MAAPFGVAGRHSLEGGLLPAQLQALLRSLSGDTAKLAGGLIDLRAVAASPH